MEFQSKIYLIRKSLLLSLFFFTIYNFTLNYIIRELNKNIIFNLPVKLNNLG
jgi:hypothetical protein